MNKGKEHWKLKCTKRRLSSLVYCTVYCNQLDKLNYAIKKKWPPELVNTKYDVDHYDNPRPHTSLITCQKRLVRKWQKF